MKERIKDLLLGFGLLAVGVVALLTIRIPVQQTRISSGAKLTYATLPKIYSWILILLVCLYMAKVVFAIWKDRAAEKRPIGGDEPKESAPEIAYSSQKVILLRTIGTVIIVLAYVLLLEHLHFFILTILFLFVLFFVYGQRSILKITAVSICGGTVFYILFIHILKLPI
ncbi:MAG: tripartite tricarboxylate transporter TctB family protein [Deltaproteobacteria bacterium]|nr:MAG: tripartite tricarboxylate transporter TctB family protein [Deltaproteobacteria bacterium]